VEAGWRLLPDKDVQTLRGHFGIDVTEPICGHGGKDAPAPDFRNLVDRDLGLVFPVPTLLGRFRPLIDRQSPPVFVEKNIIQISD